MPDIYADAFHQTAFGCFFILAEILIINVGRVQIRLCLCSFCNKKKSTLSTDVATEVVLSKKKILKNFAKFTGTDLCQSLFFNKVTGLRSATLLKKRLWYRCFKNTFFTEHIQAAFVSTMSDTNIFILKLS